MNDARTDANVGKAPRVRYDVSETPFAYLHRDVTAAANDVSASRAVSNRRRTIISIGRL